MPISIKAYEIKLGEPVFERYIIVYFLTLISHPIFETDFNLKRKSNFTTVFPSKLQKENLKISSAKLLRLDGVQYILPTLKGLKMKDSGTLLDLNLTF